MPLSGLTDSEIWSRFKKGEERAVAFIYSTYIIKLYHYGLKFTVDSEIVENSIQDLFTELIKNRQSIGNTDNILFYLLKSFKRKLQKNLEKEKRFNRKEILENRFEVIWSVENEIIDNEISEEKTKLLSMALNELTYRQKEAIYLRYSKELNYKSVAEIMNISIEACRNLISSALKILKVAVRKGCGNQVVLFLFVKGL